MEKPCTDCGCKCSGPPWRPYLGLPCLACGKATCPHTPDHRVFSGTVGPFCCPTCRQRAMDEHRAPFGEA